MVSEWKKNSVYFKQIWPKMIKLFVVARCVGPCTPFIQVKLAHTHARARERQFLILPESISLLIEINYILATLMAIQKQPLIGLLSES